MVTIELDGAAQGRGAALQLAAAAELNAERQIIAAGFFAKPTMRSVFYQHQLQTFGQGIEVRPNLHPMNSVFQQRLLQTFEMTESR